MGTRLFLIIVFLTGFFKTSFGQQGFTEADRAMLRDLDKRMIAMETRMNALDIRFTELQKQMDSRFEALQKQLDARFEAQQNQINNSFNLSMVILTAILGLIGLVIWDRKVSLRPLEKQFKELQERELRQEQELTRLKQILKKDERFSKLLDSEGL